jgi:mannose-6-phosphate isomerase-like protein (cupin superfamily)
MNILDAREPDRTVVWNDHVRANYAVWQPGYECELHSHVDAVEIFVFLEGQCEITVDDETMVVGPGQAVYAGPEQKHKLKVVGDRPLVFFLAVAPNHQPTHTIFQADGTVVEHNRQPPLRTRSGAADGGWCGGGR